MASAHIGDWIKIARRYLDARSLSRLTVLVNLVLLTMLAYSFAQLTWMLVPGESAGKMQVAPVTAAAGSSRPVNNKSMIINNIVQSHLFGSARSVVPTGRPTADIPETRLSLVLKGVVASADTRSARAIIADSAGNETFYAIGQRLPGGAELSEIHVDRVVLARHGRFETLRLPKAELGQAALAGVQKAALPSTSPSADASLRQYREQLLDQPQTVNDLLQVEPVSEAGQFTGYRLQPGRDQTFLARFGLQPGDIVTSINGITLDNPVRGLEALRNLSSADEITIELLRNGQAQKKVFSLR